MIIVAIYEEENTMYQQKQSKITSIGFYKHHEFLIDVSLYKFPNFPNFHLEELQRKHHSKQKNANLVTNSNRLMKTQVYSILSENKARKKHVRDYKLDEFIKNRSFSLKKKTQKFSICALFKSSSTLILSTKKWVLLRGRMINTQPLLFLLLYIGSHGILLPLSPVHNHLMAHSVQEQGEEEG